MVITVLSMFCMAQSRKGHKISLSIVEKFHIDSFNIRTPPLFLERLELQKFSKEQVKTPEKAVQTFISFNNEEWGKKLASSHYPDFFPGTETLENRKTEQYQKNVYAKVYFTFYFQYKGTPHSACYTESYANSEIPKYYTIFVFELSEEKWLLSDDWFLSRIDDLSQLKPEYALSLFQGKQVNGSPKFNEFYKSVYGSGTIDMGVFSTLLNERKEYFRELIN